MKLYRFSLNIHFNFQLYVKELKVGLYIEARDDRIYISLSRPADLSDGFGGFCSFGFDGFTGRDGNRYGDGTAFLNTWM